MAFAVTRTTVMTMEWIANRLQMGTRTYLNVLQPYAAKVQSPKPIDARFKRPGDELTMKAPVTVIILISTMVLSIGCNRELASVKAKVKRKPFATKLAEECNQMLLDYHQTQRYAWMRGEMTNYPITASLNPQVASISSLSGTDVVEIQITGGFSHSGIFYAPQPFPKGTELHRGNWQIQPLGNGFYWYQE
jgi:hypothetical protein